MNAFLSRGARPARGMVLRAAIIASASLVLAMLPVSAGVSLSENITLPSSWPTDVIVSTDSPGNGSSAVNATPSTIVSQTFTPTKDFILGRLLVVYQLSTASAADSFTLRIQEVPEGNNADTYASGANLLSASYLFDLDSTGGVQKMLEFGFTGSDRLLLKAGATYAVKISSTVSSVAFFRRGADSYWGGRAYSNRSALNFSGSTRDLVMALGGDPDVITIEEAISPSTAWPETVDINTCDPTSLTSGVSLSPTSRISQTITPARDMKLDTLYFPYATTSASATDSFSLSIQEVPAGPGVQTYSAGANLLGSSAPVFSLASTGGTRNLLRFGFGGENRITLKGGVTYAIELASNSSSATFYRRGSNTYSGGAAYVNRSAINYPNTRDISSAMVEGASAGYTYLPVPQSFSIQIVPGAGGADEMAQDAEAGFKQARKGVYWYSTETSLGVYNFSSTDTIVSNCAASGIAPWFTLYGGNSLYGEANDSVLTAAGRTGFANFAAATAGRYPQVKYYEIWNEPNLLSFWTPQPSVDAYCALVAAAAPAIKAVNPNAKIVGPALNVIPLGWFESACRQGLLEYVDYVSVHPYRSGAPETVLSAYEDMRMLIRKYAPAGKRIEIISGEWGYSTSSQVNTTVQAQYAARMFLSSLSVGMPLTNWYTWKDSSDYFGLVDNNRSPKPSYNAIKTLTTLLAGYTFKERLPGPSDDVFLLKFMNDQSEIAYAVWTTGADVNVNLPIPADQGLLYSIYGDWQGSAWSSSGPTITLTQSPQYLRVGEIAPVQVIVDNSDASGVAFTGTWTASSSTGGYYGSDYRHDGNAGKGARTVLYTPNLTEAGTYEVFLRWTSGTNRASNVPVTIVHAGGSTQVQVDQQANGGTWVSLGSYTFNTGTGGTVTISNAGTNGYVIADAVKLSK